MNAVQCISDFRLVLLLLLTFVTVRLTTRVGLSGKCSISWRICHHATENPQTKSFSRFFSSSVLQQISSNGRAMFWCDFQVPKCTKLNYPAGGAYSVPPDSLAGGRGLAPEELTPRSRPFGSLSQSAYPHFIPWRHQLVTDLLRGNWCSGFCPQICMRHQSPRSSIRH